MIRYAGVFILDGAIHRLTFEAIDLAQATHLAKAWGIGLDGVAAAEAKPEPLPEAYDAKTACKLLGGISRTTLYKELVTGGLERVSGTRRILVTRASIERRCR